MKFSVCIYALYSIYARRVVNIGVRTIFCQGGGGKLFAQTILASCPNFYETVEKKRG